MAYSDRDRLIALAGIFQAVLCVRKIAQQGSVDIELMHPCIYSLFQVDPKSVSEVYGEPADLIPGVRSLVEQLTAGSRDFALTRYVIALLKLERSLAKRPDMVQTIADGIENTRGTLAHASLLSPALLAQLAEIYSNALSPLQPRIVVQGEALYLKNPDNQGRIRALLLAAVRAAWLWRQVGGSRWQILLRRQRLLEEARAYLRRAQH